jgi:hypothetical protein
MIRHLLMVAALGLAILKATATTFNDSSTSTSITPPSPLSIEPQKSIWHAFDGIPILLARKSSRKLTSSLSSSSPHDDSSTQSHRSLAFGDYADPTFTCPATTTCPLICTNSTDDCPTTCALANPDSNHEFELCADGTCADLTLGEECSEDLESPCTCKGLEFTCAKVVNFYDDCFGMYQEYYDVNAECVANEEENLPQVDFTGPIFISCYAILGIVTISMFGWCAWNQRMSPVQGSCVELMAVKGGGEEKWMQTGYRRSLVGMVLNALILVVILGFQALLAFLTIEYCEFMYCCVVVLMYIGEKRLMILLSFVIDVQQEAEGLSNLKVIFADEIQVLMAFEIVWMTGFVWCFLLKWPASIQSMCLRRCLPCRAGYIAVSAPVRAVDTSYEKKCIVNFIWFLMDGFYAFMDAIFSIKSEGGETGLRYKTEFCKVRTGEFQNCAQCITTRVG